MCTRHVAFTYFIHYGVLAAMTGVMSLAYHQAHVASVVNYYKLHIGNDSLSVCIKIKKEQAELCF